jgi:predicted DNA-binding transcriptional regulator YafY
MMLDRERNDAALVRVLRLAVRLRSVPSTVEELSVAMNVTTRTVRRDLVVLQAVGVPLVQVLGEDGRRYWKSVGPWPLMEGAHA